MKQPLAVIVLLAGAVIIPNRLLASDKTAIARHTYSLGAYSGGTAYFTLSSTSFHFPPYHYKLTVKTWLEDSDGLHIIDVGRVTKPLPGDIPCESVEVESGSERFEILCGSLAERRPKTSDGMAVVRGSGQFSELVMQCVTNRGGRASTNVLPKFQASWLRHSRSNQDILILDGDHFTDVQNLLERAYGKLDTNAASFEPYQNGDTLVYTPAQVGAVVNVTGCPAMTIVSIILNQKP